MSTPRLIDPPAAAKFLGTTPDTLAVWRCTKRVDIPYVKIGRKVMYDLKDLEEFVMLRKVNCHPATRKLDRPHHTA